MTAELPLITRAAQAQGLAVSGTVAQGAAPLPEGVRTLVLLSPDEPRFWPIFTASAEYRDGAPDPLDRWSTRVIGALAARLGAQALFPFGATPPHPVFTWAQASGRAWPSPVHFLVHDRAGLWLSYRGALGLPASLDEATLDPARPCDTCAHRPCTTACPVGALTPAGYDVAACHAYLDTPAGQDCMTQGCAVRAACPVSVRLGRAPAQSAFHMRHFHP